MAKNRTSFKKRTTKARKLGRKGGKRRPSRRKKR